jgi:hypothetical protein
MHGTLPRHWQQGNPAPGYGDATFTRHTREDGSIYHTCDRADPRIRISDVLLHLIAEEKTDNRFAAEAVPATLTLPDGTLATARPERPEDWFGAVLDIDCANRHLVYRITGWEPVWLEDPGIGSYLAEWPD